MGLDSTHPASFFSHFDTLQDPRLQRCQRHHLGDILFLTICAMIAGANDFVGMQKFGHAQQDWLKKFLELPNGIPRTTPSAGSSPSSTVSSLSTAS